MIRRTLTIWLALNALAFVFAGQTWWQLSVDTGDQSVTVSGTGFDVDKSISAILMFNLAALLFVAFSRGWIAIVISSVAAASTALLTFAAGAELLARNIGGITAIVEKHTGFQVGSMIDLNEPKIVSGQIQFWAWLTVATVVALLVTQLVFAFRYRTWAKTLKPKSDRTKPKQADSDVEDTISLWDSQRG